MQIVKVMGGLGNQLFAYAFALALRKLGREVKLDISWYERIEAHNGWELERVFGLGLPLCSRQERDRLGDLDRRMILRLRRKIFGERPGHIVERGPGYDSGYLGIHGDAYFDGYWQSPRYHVGLESEIETAFRFPASLEPEAQRLVDSGRPIVGLHVRRGDYMTASALGKVCGEVYFQAAISSLTVGLEQPLILFFSDDLAWCAERLGRGLDAVYVDWNAGGWSWRDLRLMTRCDRLAIANSSFSWWGARLGRPGRQVFAPDRWFAAGHADNKELVLPGWTKLTTREDR
jgi:hypothetical protein